MPGRLWVVIEHTQLAPADRAKIDLLVIVGILFLVARLAQQRAGLHLPLPLWLCAFFHDHFAHRTRIRRFFLPDHELLCLFDMAAAAEQALNSPLIASFVLVAPEHFAAYRAIDDLLSAENMQAKILACTDTKTYVGVAKASSPSGVLARQTS